jgi:hypothetical protein
VRPARIENPDVEGAENLLRADDNNVSNFESLNQRMEEAGQFGATWGAHIPYPPPERRRR